MLKALGGNAVPSSSWGGGFQLGFIGPGPPVVHMNISVEYTEACVVMISCCGLIRLTPPYSPINNVLATIKGSEEPDRLVILGCHRDSWTMGAGDPISGHSILMETAQRCGWDPPFVHVSNANNNNSLSELLKEGWRPRRTIILASWDAEEYGMQ